MNTEIITKASEFDEVLNFIDTSIKKTTEQVLETGYGFFILKEICEREKINFTEKVQERYRINKSTVSRWLKIGSKYQSLLKYKNELPASQSTIYSLLTLPKGALDEIAAEGALHPALTFEEAERFKALYKAESKAKSIPKKKIEEENPFKIEIYKENTSANKNNEEKELNPIPPNNGKMPEPTFIEEPETIKPKVKEKNKLTRTEAYVRLQIDLDAQYEYARITGDYPEEELHEAYLLLKGD